MKNKAKYQLHWTPHVFSSSTSGKSTREPEWQPALSGTKHTEPERVHQTLGNLQRSSCCAPLGAAFTANPFMDIVMEDTVKTFDDFFRQDYKYLPYFKEIISYFLKNLTLRILLGQCKWQYSFFFFFFFKQSERNKSYYAAMQILTELILA